MKGFIEPEPTGWKEHALAELEDDIGPGDPSAALLEATRCEWRIEAQAEGIAAAVGIAAWLLIGDDAVPLVNDGDALSPGTIVLEGEGRASEVLSRERTALNYLMLLSGTASLTRKYVQAVSHTSCRILDTRKTVPGMRRLQKYAVRCGGAKNHRFALYDGIMVKDNHIVAAGSVEAAIKRAKEARYLLRTEVEVTSLDMALRAHAAGADVLLLDNMSCEELKSVVIELGGKVPLEASGGVSLETVAKIAETGVDFVSVGALTHSAPALPFHLEVS